MRERAESRTRREPLGWRAWYLNSTSSIRYSPLFVAIRRKDSEAPAKPRTAATAKSWRSYRMLRPSSGETCRLAPSWEPLRKTAARCCRCAAEHGRHGAPRAAIRATSAATGPFGFSRNTRHETRLLPGAPRKPARVSRITGHETRITAFMPCSSLFTIVHHCSRSAKNIVQASAARHSSRLLQAAAAAANPR